MSMAVTWRSAPRGFNAERAQREVVDLWRVSLDAPREVVEHYASLLNEDELRQAARFRIEDKRREFIISRGLLRRVLARAVGTDADDQRARQLILRANDHGKPTVVAPDELLTLQFNVSHTRGLALIAVTIEREVGVDVEHIGRVRDYLRLAERYFSPREYAALTALPSHAQQRAFFTCWTRKEAYLKAIGAGITLGLSRFDVTVSPDEPARLIETRHDTREAARWAMRGVELGGEYVGTLVVDGSVGGEVVVRGWDGSG